MSGGHGWTSGDFWGPACNAAFTDRVVRLDDVAVISGLSAATRPRAVQHDCAAPQPRTLLESLIVHNRQTYKQLAGAFGELARSLGADATITPRHLRRLATGERTHTSMATARVLEALFAHSVDALLAPVETPHRCQSSIHISSEEIVLMAAQQAKTFTLFSPGPLPEGTLDQLREDVARLCQAYPQQSVNLLVPELAQTQNAVFTLLERNNRPADARELYLMAGVVSGMLAKASHDMGDSHAASTQARAAFTAAELADHNGLRAWIRGLQSLVAYWAGRFGDSVKYAQEGQRFSASGTAGAWLPVSEARAWAAMGDVEHTTQCIKQADYNWQAMDTDELDELGGIATFTHSRHLYYVADALAWLPGQAGEAAQRAHTAVQAYQDRNAADWAFGDEAGSRTDLAIAHVHLRDVEAVQQALQPVLDLPQALRINGIVRSVNRVERALSQAFPGQDASVAQLREQMDDFTRTGVAPALV